MIKAITITNFLGEELRMELTRPEKSGFAVLSAKGFDPVKATINTKDYALIDGAVFNSARIPTRNIVLTLMYYPSGDQTIEDIRYKSYKFFPLMKPVGVYVETDNRNAEAVGYVESNEVNIFDEQEGSTISIICPDPFFYSHRYQTAIFSGVDLCFEFPFSNESLKKDLITLTEIMSKRKRTLLYSGDNTSGIKITIHANAPAKVIKIYNLSTGESMLINVDLETGDDLIINTKRGEKYAHLIRKDETTNVINKVYKNSTWFQLDKGENVFTYTADEGEMDLEFKIENKIAYEGM